MVEPTPLLARSRRALLDAVEALDGQRDALIVVDAQAVYLHTGVEDEAIATETRDSDIVVNPARSSPSRSSKRRWRPPASISISATLSPEAGSAPAASPST